MSGGSYDYAYMRVLEFSQNMQLRNDPLRIAFKPLLLKVAEAMRSVEWVDSCDKSPGDEHQHIKDCFDSPVAILEAVVIEAEEKIKMLQTAINLCKDFNHG